MKTVSQILRYLPADDGRREFWNRIQVFCSDGNFDNALKALRVHKNDQDYERQIVAVSFEILKNCENDPRSSCAEILEAVSGSLLDVLTDGDLLLSVRSNLLHLIYLLRGRM